MASEAELWQQGTCSTVPHKDEPLSRCIGGQLYRGSGDVLLRVGRLFIVKNFWDNDRVSSTC